VNCIDHGIFPGQNRCPDCPDKSIKMVDAEKEADWLEQLVEKNDKYSHKSDEHKAYRYMEIIEELRAHARELRELV